jgi:hypothetical protein
LQENGRLGVIVSNSWMGTDWGKAFQEILNFYFHLETIIRSGNRKWFDNADVITNLIILRKKSEPSRIENFNTRYVSTKLPISDWDNQLVDNLVSGINSEKSSDLARVRVVTREDQETIRKAGYSIRASFYENDWARRFIDASIPVSDVFDISRGARRGWNPLFYPENPGAIESEFLIPALKTTSKQEYLIAQPDSLAFCCEKSLEELTMKKQRGALNWIRAFESQVNGNGQPLPKVLARPGSFWYQMNSNERANFVISMNPYENLSFLHLETASFVDQRLISMNRLPDVSFDSELLHALLNCSLSLLGVEFLGFERGLGVLDISSTSLKRNFRMLNPKLLNSNQIKLIKSHFSILKKRKMESTIAEIKRKDRQDFDGQVLSAFGLNEFQEPIYKTLDLAIRERVEH